MAKAAKDRYTFPTSQKKPGNVTPKKEVDNLRPTTTGKPPNRYSGKAGK